MEDTEEKLISSLLEYLIDRKKARETVKVLEQAPVVPEIFPYVTINGEVPKEPTSIFHTKKFLVGGLMGALFIGLLYYFLVLVK